MNMKHRLVAALAAATVSTAVASGHQVALAAPNPAGIPAVHCQFTEPFINTVMSPEGLIVETLGAPLQAHQLQNYDTSKKDRKGYVFRVAKGQSKFIQLVVINEPGGDGMSDRVFPLTGVLDGQEGGCIAFPKGSVPRKVINVASDDVLNVRKSARASSAIVATTPSDSWVFVLPSTAKWLKTSVVTYPGGESGNVLVSSGFANRSFIADKPAKNAW
jgi:uncharacterized membrane protein